VARCFVTVEGQTLELEARTLYYDCCEYNYEQVCGAARNFPKPERGTVLSVRVAGQGSRAKSRGECRGLGN